MANYAVLKAAINAVIKTNGNKEITGQVLNQTLMAIVDSLGENYQFAGVAVPSTNPGTPDQNIFYLATQAGTYTNFGAVVLPAGISMLEWKNNTWSSETFFTIDDAPTAGSSNLVKSGGVKTAIDNVAFSTNEKVKDVGIDSTPTSGSDNLIKSGAVFDAFKNDGGAYDVSVHFPTGGVEGGNTYTLDGAIAMVPQNMQKGGMSIKFVSSSDNKYVQARCMAQNFTTDVNYWVECNSNTVEDKVLYVTDGSGNIIAKINKDGVHSIDFKYGAEGNSIKRKLEDIISSDTLFGKKICCCGDSITYGADMDSEGIAQESSINVYQSDANGNFTKVSTNFRKTYGYQIAARHNMTFYNAGVSGSTMQGLSNKYGFSLADGRYTKLPSDVDIITIFFGWNDNAYGTLGTIDDTTNESYYGGFNVVLPYLLEHHPYAKIILIVPYGCTEGHRNAVRLLADKWGVACFDMYQGGTPLYYGKEDYVGVEPGVVSANRAKYQAIGAHPNYKGHTAIGDMLESYLLTGVVNVDEKIKALIAKEEERAKAAEDTKLNYTIIDDKFCITDANGYIICQIDASGVNSVDVKVKVDEELVSVKTLIDKKLDQTLDSSTLEVTDSNGYIIARIDKDGIHSAKDKHAVACMVLSESYYPTAAPTRDSDGNVTYAKVMFETGVAGSISITYANGNSSSVAVVYGNYNYTITINRDSDGNVKTVNVQ